MCGFAGFLEMRRASSRVEMTGVVERMTGAIAHRGPDDAGLWVDPAAGIALGHRRLAILDLSPLGHQPMFSRTGRFVLVFNGEIYNYQLLRKELEDRVPFRGGSDTEVMLACFEAWGVEESLRRFNGMFAFALWDRDLRTLALARDRFGEKPVYYGWVGRSLVFASELGAMRRFPEFEARVDQDVLALYFRHNYVPGPSSIYQGIWKLPAASWVEWEAGDVPGLLPEPAVYWSLEGTLRAGQIAPLPLTDTEAIEELDQRLCHTVRTRMISDVPLGAFLSGGVDSSLIAALMQKAGSRTVRTFTIAFEEKTHNEAGHAERVANHLGTAHTSFTVTPREALEVVPELARIYDEPFADASQIPTVLLCRLARGSVTVALTGDGGDEIFGGYSRYIWNEKLWKRLCRVPAWLRPAIARAAAVVPDRAAGIVPVWLLRQRNPVENVQRLRSILRATRPEEIYRELLSVWPDPCAIVLNGKERQSAFQREIDRRVELDGPARFMWLDMRSYLPDDILVKVDRASMSVGLEGRAPLLDHTIAELAAQLPDAMRIRGGQGKWILRALLHRYVPRALVERPKQGFAVPLDGWLRHELRPWAEELLELRRLREDGFLDERPVLEKWKQHLSASHNWMYPLWGVLMFQAWLREQQRPTEMGTMAVRSAMPREWG